MLQGISASCSTSFWTFLQCFKVYKKLWFQLKHNLFRRITGSYLKHHFSFVYGKFYFKRLFIIFFCQMPYNHFYSISWSKLLSLSLLLDVETKKLRVQVIFQKSRKTPNLLLIKELFTQEIVSHDFLINRFQWYLM